jgi:hypothetical protein
MLTLWRELARKNGLPGLYLISIETTGTFGADPRKRGFDAAVEFQPNWLKTNKFTQRARKKEPKKGLWSRIFKKEEDKKMWVLDYRKLWPNLLMKKEPDYPFYPGVFPRWDNSPRMGKNALIISNSTPGEYGKWLRKTVNKLSHRPKEHRIVFINAWNEWAEGNYLEPDIKFGHAYLEATYRANLKVHDRK